MSDPGKSCSTEYPQINSENSGEEQITEGNGIQISKEPLYNSTLLKHTETPSFVHLIGKFSQSPDSFIRICESSSF